jgi:hypothetical protein
MSADQWPDDMRLSDIEERFVWFGMRQNQSREHQGARGSKALMTTRNSAVGQPLFSFPLREQTYVNTFSDCSHDLHDGQRGSFRCRDSSRVDDPLARQQCIRDDPCRSHREFCCKCSTILVHRAPVACSLLADPISAWELNWGGLERQANCVRAEGLLQMNVAGAQGRSVERTLLPRNRKPP